MIRAKACTKRLLADPSGASAMEFALLAPPLLMIFIGGMYFSMLGFSAASLHNAVQAGARCYAINTATCTSNTTTQAYTLTQFKNITGSTANITADVAACGRRVSGSFTYRLNLGTYSFTVPINATSCFPV